YAEAGLMADWLHTDKAAGAAFAAARGDLEFQTDGTMVNTWEGWRELRLGAFAKRQRGRPATADAWDSRRLPAPHARVLFGGIETAEHFGPRVRRWAARLGIRDAAAVSGLADGAEGVWDPAAAPLPGPAGAFGHLSRRGAPGGLRPTAVRRGDGRGAGLAGGGAGGAAGGRLAGAGRADGGHAAAGEVAGQAAGAGRGGGLLLPAAGAPGLR